MDDPATTDMANWDEIHASFQTIAMRIASLEEVDAGLREALGHMIAQNMLVIGMTAPIGDAVIQDRQEMQAMRDTIHQTQGRVDSMSQQTRGTQKKQGILESKATASIKTLISDKTTFRSWNEKLINVFSQARQGCRGMFRAMAEHVDQETTDDFKTLFKGTQDCRYMESQGNTYENISEDLYILLVDKTEGEAMVRVRGCSHGDGVGAYIAIYKWFMGTSRQVITEKIRKPMSPHTPKGEQDMADAADKWVESACTLENMKQ